MTVSGPRNLRALRLIDRLRRHEMETMGVQLAALRSEQASIDARSKDLTSKAKEEAMHSTTESRAFLPDFLSAVDMQQAQWNEDKNRLEAEAMEKEAALIDVFRNSKTIEIILNRALDAVQEEKVKAERSGLDEAGRASFIAVRNAARKSS